MTHSIIHHFAHLTPSPQYKQSRHPSSNSSSINNKMSQRTSRSKSIKSSLDDQQKEEQNVQLIQKNSPPTFYQKALTSTANLANLLPTGTLLAFQLLTPIFTNNGSCDVATRFMTQVLLAALAASASLACFTDSFRAQDGQVYYGFATRTGMYLFDYPAAASSQVPDLSKYRLRFVDGLHAVLSVLVFASVALRDKNVVGCLWPQPRHETEEVLNIAPLCVGMLCSLLFVVFPTRRHGIGYPVTNGN